jgi:NACalpha-BTF3-like transcription factor
VAKQRNVSPAEARKLLAAADGHLRRAISGDGDGDR